MKLRILLSLLAVLVLMGTVWGGFRVARLMARDPAPEIPTTRVKKGRVTITVTATGELQGGNSEVLSAPMVGGGDIAVTYLRDPGEFVKPGDVIAQFDTTQQEFNLREAEADLAEAEQQVIKAQADADATLEESRYQKLSTASDVKLAELELGKNSVLAAVTARQNEIAVEAARNRQQQAEHDFDNKQASASAGINIQKAAVEKARAAAENARRTIDSMVLKARTEGYVNVQQNANQNMLYYGQQLPQFQVGDTARAGQAVAQIPDMGNWEISARIPERDRGYLQAGQSVTIRVAAIPAQELKGHVKIVGAATGSAWDRSFECRIRLDETNQQLRPGMTSNISIIVESLNDVLWVPSQALFENDGRSFLYVRSKDGFVSRDVQLVRRGESQAVVSGINEGEQVALSSPDQQNKSAGPGGVMKALQK